MHSKHPSIRWIWAVGPVLVWAAMIFWWSDQLVLPSVNQEVADHWLRQLAHPLVYGVLFGLIFRAQVLLSGSTKRLSSQSFWRVMTWPLMLTMLYALSDEWHQSWVPGRTASLTDLVYDLAGALLAAVIIWTKFLQNRT